MTEGLPQPPRGLLVAAGWLAAAVAAAGITLAAVSSIGSGIFADSTQTLDRSEIAAALASSPPATDEVESPSRSPDTSASASPSAPSATDDSAPTAPQVFSSSGGSVTARCAGGDAQVVSWTPAQGYQVGGENQQGHAVEVEFESGDHEVKVRISCAGGLPTAEIGGRLILRA